MSSYNSPIENLPTFNSSLFNQPEEILSQAEADKLYLSKTKNDTSTAPLTIFNNQVQIKGEATFKQTIFQDTLSSVDVTGKIYQVGSVLSYFDTSPSLLASSHQFYTRAAGNATDNLQMTIANGTTTITDGTILNTRQIKSTSTASTAHTLFDNMTAGGKLTIGSSASDNVINGYNSFTSTIALKNNRYKICEQLDFTASSTYTITIPFSQTYTIRSAFTSITITLPTITSADAGTIINLVKVQGSSNISATINSTAGVGLNTIYTQNDLAGGSSSNTSLLSVNKMATTLMAAAASGTAYWLELGGASTYDIAQNNLIYPRLAIANAFSDRLNFSGASYSFPFASSQSLGYYLKTTGTAFTTLISATPTTIVTTASIPIGVWRIDFSVQNVVGAAGAGTITQSQTYISPTLDGNVGTAVDFTGSVIRSHVSEVYGNNDVQEIAGSFTYQQTTAGVLRLNIVKSFATGTYSFTGEIGITRLA